MGVNHYMTSERFLDHRVERYPEHARGGNGRSAYADVEAVRVLANGVAGPRALLDQAWNRYRLPLVPPAIATKERIARVLQELKLQGAAARV